MEKYLEFLYQEANCLKLKRLPHGTFPCVCQGFVSHQGGTLVYHSALQAGLVEANHVRFVGIRVQSFTRHSLCTKHNFSKEKHLQLIN